jgi:hypothetical protein
MQIAMLPPQSITIEMILFTVPMDYEHEGTICNFLFQTNEQDNCELCTRSNQIQREQNTKWQQFITTDRTDNGIQEHHILRPMISRIMSPYQYLSSTDDVAIHGILISMPSNRFLIRTEQYKRGTNTLNIFEKQIHVVHFSGKSIRTLKSTPAIGSPLQSRGDGTALLNAVVKRAVQ